MNNYYNTAELRKEATARKAKRAEKAKVLWRGKPKNQRVRSFRPIGQSRRGAIKADIVRLLGEIDRELNGNECRIHQGHKGDCAYHLVPQCKGDAARFLSENVVWACSGANDWEHSHRAEAREMHVRRFGLERIKRIEETARGIVHYTTTFLTERRDHLRAAIKALP